MDLDYNEEELNITEEIVIDKSHLTPSEVLQMALKEEKEFNYHPRGFCIISVNLGKKTDNISFFRNNPERTRYNVYKGSLELSSDGKVAQDSLPKEANLEFNNSLIRAIHKKDKTLFEENKENHLLIYKVCQRKYYVKPLSDEEALSVQYCETSSQVIDKLNLMDDNNFPS